MGSLLLMSLVSLFFPDADFNPLGGTPAGGPAASSGTPPFSSGTPTGSADRAQINQGLERYAEWAVANGVRYQMGAKGTYVSDCSGFVDNGVSAVFSNAGCLTDTNSEGQIKAIAAATGGYMLRGNAGQVGSQLREGFVVGIDSGNYAHDRGRQLGIDHIGYVYRDSQTGQLMFAESASSQGGANTQSLDDWLAKAGQRGYSLYAVDLARIDADNRPQTVLAHEGTLSTPGSRT